MGERLKYRVVKQHAAPKLSIKELETNRKCYLGVSLNNPFFYGKHLDIFLTWIDSHFDECTIIIGDYLNRINEYISYGITGSEAIASSQAKGNELHEIFSAAIQKQTLTTFRICHWKDFIDQYPETLLYKQKIFTFFKTNQLFRNALLQSSSLYIDRKIENGETLFLTREDAIEQSHEYLIEEMAVFNKFIELGYIVKIYPGTQLDILKQFANGQYVDLDMALSKGIYIDLTIKKRIK